MPDNKKKTLEEKLTLASWIMSVIATTIIGVYLVWLRRELPPEIPVFYSHPWGQAQLAHPVWILLPLVLMVTGGIVVPWVSKWKVKEKILTVMLVVATLVFQLLLLLAVLRILSLVL